MRNFREGGSAFPMRSGPSLWRAVYGFFSWRDVVQKPERHLSPEINFIHENKDERMKF